MKRLYHFINAEFGLLGVENRRLKIATLDNLNDPFEYLSIDTSDRKIRRALHKEKHRASLAVGCLSFCDIASNPVMWAHYADRHKGICLAFDVAETFVFPIEYVSTRHTSEYLYKLISQNPLEEGVESTFLAKSDYWSYEKEWRLWLEISEENKDEVNGHHFAKFDENIVLKEILIGMDCKLTKSDFEKYFDDDFSPTIKKYRAAFKSFKMVEHLNYKFD